MALGLFAAVLASIGGVLFVGEWLFGSIGWGITHGLVLCVALSIVAVFAIIEAPRGITTWGFIGAAVIGVIVTVLLGANVARQAATSAADQLRSGSWSGLDPGWGPAIVGVIAGAVVLALIAMIVLALVGGWSGAVGGLVLGAIGGALVGWWVAGVEFSWHGAAAVGVTIGLVAWPALMGVGLWRAKEFDPTARFRRLVPQQSIDAAQETKTWLEEEWAKRRGKLGIG